MFSSEVTALACATVSPGLNTPFHGSEVCDAAWRESADMLFALRLVGTGYVFEAINPAFETSTGLQFDDVTGRSLEEVLPPKWADGLAARCQECLIAGKPLRYIEALPLPSGRWHWETTLTSVRASDGAVQIILGSAREINDSFEAQIARFGVTGWDSVDPEVGPTIHFTAYPDGRPDRLSPSFFDYTGISATASAAIITAAVHPEDLNRLVPQRSESPHDGAYLADIRVRRWDGQYRTFRFRTELIEGLGGRRWYGVASDVGRLEFSDPRPALSAVRENPLNDVRGCSFVIDRSWRITGVSPQAAAWVGRSEGELMGRDLRTRVPMAPGLVGAIADALESCRAGALEMPALLHAERWLEFHIYPTADDVVVMFWDVTERRRAEAAVEATRELLQGLSDASSAEMALLGEDGLIVSVNSSFRMLLDPPAQDRKLVGRSYLDICRRLIPGLDHLAHRRGLRELIAGRTQSYTQAYVIESPTGLRWRQIRLSPLHTGTAAHFVAIHEDLSDTARDKAALHSRAHEVLSAQEAERQRIAIELHDSTMQHLVALDMGVARLRRLFPHDDGADDVLDDMSKAAQEALKEIRILSYLMKPQEGDSLEGLVQRFVQGFGRRTGHNTSFRAQGSVDAVSAAVRHAAFRIVQAAVSNVYRHAEAKGVEVELTSRNGLLTVRIADDGKGMPPLQLAEAQGVSLGVGITGMQARVAQLGGKLTVGGDGAGTVVTAILPALATATLGRLSA